MISSIANLVCELPNHLRPRILGNDKIQKNLKFGWRHSLESRLPFRNSKFNNRHLHSSTCHLLFSTHFMVATDKRNLARSIMWTYKNSLKNKTNNILLTWKIYSKSYHTHNHVSLLDFLCGKCWFLYLNLIFILVFYTGFGTYLYTFKPQVQIYHNFSLCFLKLILYLKIKVLK